MHGSLWMDISSRELTVAHSHFIASQSTWFSSNAINHISSPYQVSSGISRHGEVSTMCKEYKCGNYIKQWANILPEVWTLFECQNVFDILFYHVLNDMYIAPATLNLLDVSVLLVRPQSLSLNIQLSLFNSSGILDFSLSNDVKQQQY